MSCPCSELTANSPVDPCKECPPNSAANESLPSIVENFAYHFFGTLTKSDSGQGQVVWQLPCDLATGIEGNPRQPGEGLACYFKRILEAGVIGRDGAPAWTKNADEFIQPAENDYVWVHFQKDLFYVGQYLWAPVGGFYKITDTVVGQQNVLWRLKNLRPAPDNLGEGGTIPAGTTFFPSGPAAIPGAKGDAGTPGTNGTSSFLYIAYAEDSNGTGFTMNPATPGVTYYAIKVSPTVIETPQASDFTGLWVRFQGLTGPAGPAGSDVPQKWEFRTNGTHTWKCPVGVSRLRVRVYGAGGGGGGGASLANGSGNGYGGGGGEYSQGIVNVSAGTYYTIVVGKGGTGGTGGNAAANGTDGGDSSFYDANLTYLVSLGGDGGTAAVNGSPHVGAGGSGGSGYTVPEIPNQPGLDGGLGTANHYLGGHAGRLGAGGLGGLPGETPGGGGGGGMGDAGGPGAAGADGANGMVVIEAA